MKEKEETNIALGCVLLLLFVPLLALWGAFAMQTAWGWFLEPLGAPPIGLAHAGGLSAFIHMITMKIGKPADEADGTTASMITMVVRVSAYQLAAFGSLYLWHWFMVTP